MSGPHNGDLALEERAPGSSGIESYGACVQELHETGVNGDPILEKRTGFHVHWVPGQSKGSTGI